VKNPFGIVPINVFQLGVIYKSHRQVQTLIYNSHLLLKLPILDKFRLATFHKSATQRNYCIKTGINQSRISKSSHDFELDLTIWRRALLKHALFIWYHWAWRFCRSGKTASLSNRYDYMRKPPIETTASQLSTKWCHDIRHNDTRRNDIQNGNKLWNSA